MTLKDVEHGGFPDALADDFVDEPTAPEDAGKPTPPFVRDAPKPEERHLANGGSTKTLCGLDRAGLKTAHPSKAKKTDCLGCRDAYRLNKPVKGDKWQGAMNAGDRVAFPCGSVWLVEEVRPGGAEVRCLIASSLHKKGATTIIAAESALDKLTPEQFEAALEASKPKAEPKAEKKAAEPKKERTPAWKPTWAEYDEVMRLRALGVSFIGIELTLGWPDGHGNRPWKIVKGYTKPAGERPVVAAAEKVESAPE